MTYQDIRVNDEVFWNDPDNGLSSGIYYIYAIGEDEGENTVVSIENGFTEADVYLSELS